MHPSLRLGSVLLLVAGCGRPLPSETEKVDLAPGGLSATLDAPKGAIVTKRVLQGAVAVDWGDLDGSITLGPWSATSPTLACPAYDHDCKVVESDATSVLFTTKFQRKPGHFGYVDRTLGSTKLQCAAVARDLDNARRLVAACKTLSGTGAVLSSPPTSAPTLTSATVVVLEDLALKEKTPSGEIKLSLRAPKGWESQAISPAGRMFLDPAAKTAPADAITIRVTPFPAVKTLAQAEEEWRRADVGGLDTIAERRALSAKTFLLSTAPRGKGQIMAVNVYASGKKQAMWAQCYGPAKRKSTLEDVCSSLKVE